MRKKNLKLFGNSKKHYVTNNSTSKQNPFLITEAKIDNLGFLDKVDYDEKNEEFKKNSKNLDDEEDKDVQILKNNKSVDKDCEEAKERGISLVESKALEDSEKSDFKDESKK